MYDCKCTMRSHLIPTPMKLSSFRYLDARQPVSVLTRRNPVTHAKEFYTLPWARLVTGARQDTNVLLGFTNTTLLTEHANWWQQDDLHIEEGQLGFWKEMSEHLLVPLTVVTSEHIDLYTRCDCVDIYLYNYQHTDY